MRRNKITPAKGLALAKDQRGAALIAALLAAALVASLAAAMMFSQQVDIRRSANVLHADQAYLYTIGVEDWLTLLLERAEPGEEHEYLGEGLPPISIEGGELTGRIDDLQGLFNVNNLLFAPDGQQERVRDQFKSLLALCGLDMELEAALSDWLDPDQEPRFPGGAEDREYLQKSPAYRTADRPINDPRELKMVLGFAEPEFDECLLPLLSALPEYTSLNVNSAEAPLVASLSEVIDLAGAERIVESRPAGGYKELSEFVEHPALAGSGIGAGSEFLDLKSSYFMLQSNVRIGQSGVVLYSTIKRKEDGVMVISRNR